MGQEPLISCLCVTHERAPFMPWLLWSFNRQSWSNKELLIVDSSRTPWVPPRSQEDIRVLQCPEFPGVPAKRNLALTESRGELICWFDDDDWQHPDRLVILAAAMEEGAAIAGSKSAFFLGLQSQRCRLYHARKFVIFNSACFRREVALSQCFDTSRRRGSDTAWMNRISRGHTSSWLESQLFFWLCHEDNLSNPVTKRGFDQPLRNLQECCGSAWKNTDEHMNRLKERLLKRYGADAEIANP